MLTAETLIEALQAIDPKTPIAVKKKGSIDTVFIKGFEKFETSPENYIALLELERDFSNIPDEESEQFERRVAYTLQPSKNPENFDQFLSKELLEIINNKILVDDSQIQDSQRDDKTNLLTFGMKDGTQIKRLNIGSDNYSEETRFEVLSEFCHSIADKISHHNFKGTIEGIQTYDLPDGNRCLTLSLIG